MNESYGTRKGFKTFREHRGENPPLVGVLQRSIEQLLEIEATNPHKTPNSANIVFASTLQKARCGTVG